jgi:hypothetical protein
MTWQFLAVLIEVDLDLTAVREADLDAVGSVVAADFGLGDIAVRVFRERGSGAPAPHAGSSYTPSPPNLRLVVGL